MKPPIIYLSHRCRVPFAMKEVTMLQPDFTYVHSGSLLYSIDGCKPFPVNAGDVLFVRIGQKRERFDGAKKAVYTSIILHEDFPLPSVSIPTLTHNAADYDIAFCIDRLTQLYVSDESYAKKQMESLMSYLLYAVAALQDTQEANEYAAAMKKHIDENWYQKLLLEDVAAAAHISKPYASVLFKKTYGSTITDYILSVRLENAKKMLCYTDASGEIIAESCGFCDQFYFSRIFKKKVGLSPSAFRSKHRAYGGDTMVHNYI